MELGKIQKLTVASKKDGRVSLKDQDGERVNLARGEGEDLKVGEEVEAFVYNIHEEFEATLKRPFAQVGELKIKSSGQGQGWLLRRQWNWQGHFLTF